MNIAVIGCGAWGTVISQLLSKNSKDITVFCHRNDIVEEINEQHTNALYLPKEPILNSCIQAKLIPDFYENISEYDVIVIVVASPFYREVLEKIEPNLKANQILLTATKGMEEKSLKSVYDISVEVLSKEVCDTQFAVLSGPNLAKEIYLGKPAATVIASHNRKLAQGIQQLISSETFRAYMSEDVLGVVYGGILKNIFAIAAGVLDALDFGANAKSALMVRSMSEIKRYALHFGAKEESLMGLAGFGDLVTTCMSSDSRNYQTGFRLAKGESLETITASMLAISEGVKTCRVIYKIAQNEKINMPITDAVYRLLYKKDSVQSIVRLLMTRKLKTED